MQKFYSSFVSLIFIMGASQAWAVSCPAPAGALTNPGSQVQGNLLAEAAARSVSLDPALTCFDISYAPPCAADGFGADGVFWRHAQSGGQCYSMYSGVETQAPTQYQSEPSCVPPSGAVNARGFLASSDASATVAAQSRNFDPAQTCFDIAYAPACAGDAAGWYHGQASGRCYSMYRRSRAESQPNTQQPIGGNRNFEIVPGSPRKVCQIFDDYDSHFGVPTLNQTRSNYGIVGADLGISFEHNGQLAILWGDTINAGDSDSISFSNDRDGRDCIDMRWNSRARGQFQAFTVPGVNMGTFGVPTGGFSMHGNMYAVVSDAHHNRMYSSHLAVSHDNGFTWNRLMELSNRVNVPEIGRNCFDPQQCGKFVGASAHVTDTSLWGGQLPDSSGPAVLFFGTGEYRKSDMYLAYLHGNYLNDRTAVRYFAGKSGDGRPIWSAREEDAQPIIRQYFSPGQDGMGEISVEYIPQIRKWVTLYHHSNPYAINMRIADSPWGEWSDVMEAYSPSRDDRSFMYAGGGIYGPYMIPRFTHFENGDPKLVRIYFMMSTWEPYNTMLMSTVIRVP